MLHKRAVLCASAVAYFRVRIVGAPYDIKYFTSCYFVHCRVVARRTCVPLGRRGKNDPSGPSKMARSCCESQHGCCGTD
eukprot:scaffold34197_cov70-Phaeocystis_antarctica.AAC.6